MLISSSTHLVTTAPPVRRADRRRRKFASALIQGLRSAEGVSLVGKDKELGKKLNYLADTDQDLIVHRVFSEGVDIVIVGIPNAVWYCKRTMRALKHAIGILSARGHRIATIPQRAVEALGRPGAPHPPAFFRALVDEAAKPRPEFTLDCAYGVTHEPTGCFAIRMATGSSCHH